ncbi:MAG: S41 family peptidase [Leptospiraceae bacterium]|nr:S41 family peptidase [Leptospiraceae bacterium]
MRLIQNISSFFSRFPRISFPILFLFVIFFVSITCEPKSVKKAPKTKFTQSDFEDVLKSIDEKYIEKNIDVNRAYTDAAVFAMMSLPHGLFIYPETYYEEREKFEEKDDIPPGKTFKLSPTDKFLVFDPDYPKLEKMRKAKAEAESKKPKLSNDELKNLIEREQARKAVLASRWEETKFGKQDFDRVMSFIQDNLPKYKTPVLKDSSIEEGEEQKEEFSMKDVWLAATNGYLNSLDPHTNVFLKEVWDDSIAKIQNGSFEGIGAILTGGGTREVLVENPLEDRPAVKAGLRAGDVIVAVDGKSTKGISLDKVVSRIKGEKGTTVSLLVKRKGVAKNFEIKVVRATIEIKNVQSRLIKDNEHIAYIKLSGFVKTQTESSDKDIKTHFHKLEDEAKNKKVKLKALILDLRNNAGGYLDLAHLISDMFIKSGEIVSIRNPSKGRISKIFAQHDDLTDLPLVILINAKSASASEIVASAIKDYGRGLLLGERTFGKATVQTLEQLPNNSDYLLKVTESRYYAPSGRTIQVVGVEPDIAVSAEEDGSFPFQYREENMWHHLPKISSEIKTKVFFDVKKLEDWVKENGKAKKIIEDSKNSPIKPDFQLIRSIDYVNALINVK